MKAALLFEARDALLSLTLTLALALALSLTLALTLTLKARDALLFESLHRVAELPCAASLQLLAHPNQP